MILFCVSWIISRSEFQFGNNASRSKTDSNIKGKRSFVPKIWKCVTFCDISKCHHVTILNFVTFLGVCHTVCIFFLVFLAKPKMSKKRRNVTNVTKPALFRRSANIYVSKLRFAVVWLGQIHNLVTGHVYVLGLKSGSERLWSSGLSVTVMQEMVRDIMCECKCEKVSRDTVTGGHRLPL